MTVNRLMANAYIIGNLHWAPPLSQAINRLIPDGKGNSSSVTKA
ncbi:hypothetical protein [Polynucleobacter necessarius]|nr:hypothetical protein [Polynucleobacter necessarius]